MLFQSILHDRSQYMHMYFLENKGEDWEISLYVNWLAGNQISAFEENALWTTPELNGELLVSGL